MPRGNHPPRIPPRTGALPPLEPLDGTGQEAPIIRLDPNAPPGEISFVIPGQDKVAKSPTVGLTAEASGPIPPQLLRAVDEALGFIYGLDQQFENQGRRPKK